jgi:hypothetical protein
MAREAEKKFRVFFCVLFCSFAFLLCSILFFLCSFLFYSVLFGVGLFSPGPPAFVRLYSCRRDINRRFGEIKTHRGKNERFFPDFYRQAKISRRAIACSSCDDIKVT